MQVKRDLIMGTCLQAIASVLLIVALSHCAEQRAQTVTSRGSRDEHVQRIISSLEPDNTLRMALERGDRGKGLHRAWMDLMKRHGVKQASYRIRFVWSPTHKKLDIQDAVYLTHYYRFDSKISHGSRLKRISQSGLEKALVREILVRARRDVSQRVQNLGSRWLCGLLYLNLLDDEVLPILDEPADVSSTHERGCFRGQAEGPRPVSTKAVVSKY